MPHSEQGGSEYFAISIDDIERQRRNEETTKLRLITPAIQAKWPNVDQIIMEYYLTDGRITVDEYGIGHRGKPKKVDYLLLFHRNIPLALVEAKGEDHSADDGYSQAVEYAELLDVPFAYATNGHELIEKDMISGLNRTMSISDFPGPDELWERYKKEAKIAPESEAAYTYPYYTTPTGKTPRYYQRIIINRTTKAVIEGRKRILIVCATGTGKTFEAFQLIYRFLKSGLKRRVLFLADRNILVDQTMKEDFAPFEDIMVKLDNSKLDTAHQVYLGIYQQLVTTQNGQIINHYKKYPRDFFDLIIVDECHRSSADTASNWHAILDYFDEATKIGLTATPKDDNDPSRSNFAYFGEPIYTYSLKQGIDDGFLAPYKVVIPELDIDRDGYTPPEGTVDVDGNPIEIRTYTQREFDRNIIVAERRETVAKRISEYMAVNDMRFAKTIVFCEDIPHCQEMVRLLENENADLVAENPHYVQQITGDNEQGKAQLEYFIENKCKYPVIAVTSRLMSTGVNAKTCELIVLDRTIGSMTEFKQIIGRGTRIVEKYTCDGEEKSKMYFTILDFRSNYQLFNDPDFDGDPTGGGIINVPPNGPMPKPPIPPAAPPIPPTPPQNRRVARVNGVDVEIVGEMVKYLDSEGRLVQVTLTSCVRNNILGQYEDMEDFRQAWLLTKNKAALANQLLLEVDWTENFETRYGYKVDPFDIIASMAYDIDPPMSKSRRTHSAGMLRFLDQTRFDEGMRELLRLLLDAYVETDFEKLRDLDVFNLPQFKSRGWTKLGAIKRLGGKAKYHELLHELENALYEQEK